MPDVQHDTTKAREGRGRGPREGGPPREGGGRGDDRRPDRGRFEGPPEIELEKLISDSLYLDNQAHAIVSRMRVPLQCGGQAARLVESC